MMNIEWTPELKEAVVQRVNKFLIEHDAFSSDVASQDEDFQMSSCDVMVGIVRLLDENDAIDMIPDA